MCCSYVLASYAHFLWEAEDDEEEEEDSRYETETGTEKTHGFPASFFPAGPLRPPLAAAS